MNIFILDLDQKKAAEYHNNAHNVKMILEISQLLSTAHRVLDGQDKQLKDITKNNLLYKATHVNHPCAKWVREDKSNYDWTYKLLVELCKEYSYRYEKIHKVEYSGLLAILETSPINQTSNFNFPNNFVLAMPDYCKVDNPVDSYRNYYNKEKQHLLKWKKRQVPDWVLQNYVI